MQLYVYMRKLCVFDCGKNDHLTRLKAHSIQPIGVVLSILSINRTFDVSSGDSKYLNSIDNWFTLLMEEWVSEWMNEWMNKWMKNVDAWMSILFFFFKSFIPTDCCQKFYEYFSSPLLISRLGKFLGKFIQWKERER